MHPPKGVSPLARQLSNEEWLANTKKTIIVGLSSHGWNRGLSRPLFCNVYRLICRSNKPEAEKFETWVFDELLPRIRQTGGYVNDPVVFVDNWLPNTDAKTKALLVTSLEAVKNQDNIIGVQQESVEFHRAVSASVNSVDFGEFAKCLANDHINIGRNRLMAWLRKEKYIDSANVAYQRYIEQGIFEVKETVYYVGTTYHTSRKTLITPKGQVYLAKKVSKGYKG